jgi:hypothetical protein
MNIMSLEYKEKRKRDGVLGGGKKVCDEEEGRSRFSHGNNL